MEQMYIPEHAQKAFTIQQQFHARQGNDDDILKTTSVIKVETDSTLFLKH